MIMGGYRDINVAPVIVRVVEKVGYLFRPKESSENSLASSQFAYRDGGCCTNALLTIQHRGLSFLDNSACKGIRLFSMDLSKTLDIVKHVLLADKLKSHVLNPYIQNWCLSCLSDWQQRVVYNNSFFGEWKDVNKGMTQESVNVFLNDLNIQLEGVDILFKYVDDTNIVIPLWKDGVDQSPKVMGNFLRWSEKNSMSCNPGKSKELTMRKKGFVEELCKIHNLPQCSELKLIGVIFQYNCKHASHVREKLVKANKCLHVVRTLRQEGYNQEELDYLFQSIVMANFLYGLSVYGAYKRKYISRKLNARVLLERSDCRIFRQASRTNSPLVPEDFTRKEFHKLRAKKTMLLSFYSGNRRFRSFYVNKLTLSYDINSLM